MRGPLCVMQKKKKNYETNFNADNGIDFPNSNIVWTGTDEY